MNWAEELFSLVSISRDPNRLSGEGDSDALQIEAKTVKYMLLIYGQEKALTDGERQKCYVESTQLTHELHAKKQFLGAAPLQPVAMVEARDLDEAICIAARIPAARWGTVEVRPVVDLPGLPEMQM